MNYARYVINYSGTALRHHYGTLFKDMEPKGDLFLKIIWPKFYIGPQGRAFKEFNLGIPNLIGTQFKSLVNWVPLRNTPYRLKPPDPMNHVKVFM